MCQEGKSKYANAKVSGGAGVSQQGQKQVSMTAPTYRACKSKCCTTRPPRGHCTRARLLNGWIPSYSPGASAKDHQCHSVRPGAGTRTAHIPWGIILIHLFEFQSPRQPIQTCMCWNKPNLRYEWNQGRKMWYTLSAKLFLSDLRLPSRFLTSSWMWLCHHKLINLGTEGDEYTIEKLC